MSKVQFDRSEPFVRMVKRASIPQWKAWLIRAIALAGALIAGGLLILILGNNPLQVYANMVDGALGKQLFVQETIKSTIPLLIAAIGVGFSFRMKFWNIGGEGQILVGGIAAGAVAIYFGQTWARFPLLVAMGLAAMIASGLYGVIPALFKSKWGTNETLFTLMLNYIALQFVKFLAYQPMWQQKGTTFPKITPFPPAASLPKVFGIHIGWIIAIVVVILAALYMSRTKQGYEIAVVGESNNTARYAGMSVSKVFIRTMFISGALGGLAGYLIVSGADGTLSESTAGGQGFTAITVAWLAKMNPVAMVVVAFFIAILQRGANRIETTHGIPKAAANVLIGIILFFMLGCEFFINYQLIFRGGRKEKA